MKPEDIARFLPKYLSPDEQADLLLELKGFPANIDRRFYTSVLRREETNFQGDGLEDLLVVNLPDPRVGPAKCMVLSNTCDLDPANSRPFQARLVYAPIMLLEKYKAMLQGRGLKTGQALDSHLAAVRRQQITQIC